MAFHARLLYYGPPRLWAFALAWRSHRLLRAFGRGMRAATTNRSCISAPVLDLLDWWDRVFRSWLTLLSFGVAKAAKEMALPALAFHFTTVSVTWRSEAGDNATAELRCYAKHARDGTLSEGTCVCETAEAVSLSTAFYGRKHISEEAGRACVAAILWWPASFSKDTFILMGFLYPHCLSTPAVLPVLPLMPFLCIVHGGFCTYLYPCGIIPSICSGWEGSGFLYAGLPMLKSGSLLSRTVLSLSILPLLPSDFAHTHACAGHDGHDGGQRANAARRTRCLPSLPRHALRISAASRRRSARPALCSLQKTPCYM